MIRKENNFSVNQTVFFKKESKIQSGVVRFVRHKKDDLKIGNELIMRSLVNTEYFIDGSWHEESLLRDNPAEFLIT